MYFVDKFNKASTEQGEIALFWLGQAGFIIKNSYGETLAIDPYLSNLVERTCGLKRIMMPIISPEDLNVDILLISHHHDDHLDMDSIPSIMKNKNTKLLSPTTGINICKKKGINEAQLISFNYGDKIKLKHFELEAVFADHGDMAPDAIGILVNTDHVLIYFASDTAYQSKRMEYVSRKNIHILVTPINGEYGNLNERDAAMLAKQVGAELVIPSHFWMFIRHGADPYAFDREMKIEAPKCENYFMRQGEEIKYHNSKGLTWHE